MKGKMLSIMVPVTLGVLALLTPATPAAGLEVLYIGDPFGSSPYFALEGEPGIQLHPVPAFTIANSYPSDWGRRVMRAYFPRSYGELSGLQVILLSDVRMDLFTARELEWISESVLEDGNGLAMIGGLDSFSGVGENSWHLSPVGALIPVAGGEPNWAIARISWFDEDDPFVASLPFGELGKKGAFSGFNMVEEKPGSSAVAYLESQLGSSPLISYWEVGAGLGFAFASEWKGDTLASFCRTPEECHLRGTRWGNQFASWSYAPDFARNLVYLLARRPFPNDTSGPHLFRAKSDEYDLGMSLALLQVEVLDRLGVPTGDIEVVLDGARVSYGEARGLYQSGLLDESLSRIDEALSRLSSVGPTSSRLEEEHLAWMYLVEVATVASAGILAGLVFERASSGYRRRDGPGKREE